MEGPPPISREAIRRLICGDDPGPRSAFLGNHGTDVEKAIDALSTLCIEFERLSARWELTERAAAVMLFVHAAANSILTALRLLVTCYPVPAGNMMRHHAEAVAVALLMSDPESNAFDVWRRDRQTYPYRKALDRVSETKTANRLKRRLKFDPAAWKRFKDLMEFYHAHSHLSAVSVAFYMTLGEPGRPILGSEYDPEKREMYEADVGRCRGAAENVRVLVRALDHVMPKSKS